MNLDNQNRLEDVLVRAENILLAGKKPVAEQDWIYLIHHLHQADDFKDVEIVHHCELYEKKGLKGKKYYQKHVKDKKLIQHVLDIKKNKLDKAPKVVYDHLNNGFKVKILAIEKEKYAVLNGLVNVKKTKWSDQDKAELL